ncbi:MAG TPA: pirin family protein [Burkholderiales bacterium]|nr:pirin family protein [Burkholderiales bacterium]
MKKIVGIHQGPSAHWVGNGFHVRSLFMYDQEPRALSPFLMLDYAAPEAFSPSREPRGVGRHPHRGFETVTIAYQGGVEHRDSAGNHGIIGPGDVQWMTAASGIVHEEWHESAFTRQGGTMEMAQLWVNLPAKDKMAPPAYQDIRAAQIPVVDLGSGGSLRVIAGEFRGNSGASVKGPARTFTPINVWDTQLKAGSRVELDVPDGYTTLLAVLRGKVLVNGDKSAGAANLVTLERAGTQFTLEASEDSVVLVLNGQPIDEPVIGYGPFVMNTEAEIHQAIRDYQSGRLERASAGR